jgi:hypothetical protein
MSTSQTLLHQDCSGHVKRAWLTEVVTTFRVEIALSVVIAMACNHGTETVLGSLNRTVNQGELSDVILVDHSQNWLGRLVVDLGLAVQLLVGRLKFSLWKMLVGLSLTNPSSGIRPKVSCLGLRL